MVGIDPKVYIDQYRSLQTLKPGISITKGLEHLVRPSSWVEATRDFPLAVTFFESFFHGIRIGDQKLDGNSNVDIFFEGLQGGPPLGLW